MNKNLIPEQQAKKRKISYRIKMKYKYVGIVKCNKKKNLQC